MTDRYERMDYTTLVRDARRMDRELTMLWDWYSNMESWIKENLPCQKCGAIAGGPCVTSNGFVASYPHADREHQFQRVRGSL